MKKHYLGLSVIVILVAAGTYLAGSKLLKSSTFVVYQVERMNSQETRQVVRAYKPSGEWMETSTNIKTGVKQIMLGTTDAGVVRVDETKKENEFVGGWAMPITAEEIKKDPGFIDETEILGYQVLRVRLESKTDGSAIDIYRAPKLHGMILKLVVKEANGDVLSLEPERVERTSVEFALPKYPVTRDTYNLRHQK